MSKAQAGHSALDAGAGVRGELAAMDNDGQRERFLRAAVEHTAAQVGVLEKQVDDLVDKAEEVAVQWDAKIAEAERMRDVIVAALAAYQAELEDMVG
jgi:hypothetical protein